MLGSIPWWGASLVSNATIVAVEYMNRTGGYPTFGHALLRTAPLILVMQWGLFRAWSGAPTMLLAWAFFVAGNTVARLLSVQFLVPGERVSTQELVATAVIVGGVFLMKGAK